MTDTKVILETGQWIIFQKHFLDTFQFGKKKQNNFHLGSRTIRKKYSENSGGRRTRVSEFINIYLSVGWRTLGRVRSDGTSLTENIFRRSTSWPVSPRKKNSGLGKVFCPHGRPPLPLLSPVIYLYFHLFTPAVSFVDWWGKRFRTKSHCKEK